MGFLGNLVAGRMIKKRLNRMFTAREIRLERDLKRHAEFSHVERRKFLWLDHSGLIGRQLVAFLDTGGHDVWRLVKKNNKTR